jgi:hypothetical protein
MKNHDTNYESLFWRILEKNRLVDLSQFHKPGFFEEVPLYTRSADISFLSDYSSDEASSILLKFALKFLKSVVSYEEHETPFFAAITVADFSAGDPIVPNLFVWSNPVRELFEKLILKAAMTPFGKKIKRLVSQFHLPDLYEVLEDTSTNPDFVRAFIAPSLPPYRGFVPIYMFCKPQQIAAEQTRRKRPKLRTVDDP